MNKGVKDSIFKSYHPKGYLQKVQHFKNGQEQGYGMEYAADGRLVSLIKYNKGTLVAVDRFNTLDKFGFKQGVWKSFLNDTILIEEGTWKDDKKNGFFKTYGIDGFVLKMENWRNGELVIDEQNNVSLEINRKYHNNGRPKSSVNIINGVMEGYYREYNDSGIIVLSKLYEKNKVIAEGGIIDGNGLQQGAWTYFYPNGKVKSKGSFKNGKRDGKWTFYYPSQKVEQTGSYKNNLPDNNWKWYYESGQLLREENYIKGKEDGESLEYDENGTLISKGLYVDGKRDGEWKFKNGEYIAQGKYVDGKMDGEWKQYYQNGKLAFEGSYFDGLENGEHRYYYDNGKLKEEKNFRMGLKDGIFKSFDENGELVLTSVYKADNLQRLEGVKVGE
jgi:antitoxin component YwqK of YwqJK toxin-antitoxin module